MDLFRTHLFSQNTSGGLLMNPILLINLNMEVELFPITRKPIDI